MNMISHFLLNHPIKILQCAVLILHKEFLFIRFVLKKNSSAFFSEIGGGVVFCCVFFFFLAAFATLSKTRLTFFFAFNIIKRGMKMTRWAQKIIPDHSAKIYFSAVRLKRGGVADARLYHKSIFIICNQ